MLFVHYTELMEIILSVVALSENLRPHRPAHLREKHLSAQPPHPSQEEIIMQTHAAWRAIFIGRLSSLALSPIQAAATVVIRMLTTPRRTTTRADT